MLPATNQPGDYIELLERLKSEIRITQLRATIAANAEFLALYWRMGNIILEQEKQQGWGQKVVVRLVADLKAEFPNMKGMSPRNLRYMKSFAAAYPDDPFGEKPILQVALAKIDLVSSPHLTGQGERPCRTAILHTGDGRKRLVEGCDGAAN